MAAAINQGLLMDPAEKIERHAKLYKVVTTHTSHSWAAVLVKMLLGQMGLQGMARQTPYIPKEKLEGLYEKAKKRLFLFDYDVCYFFFFIRLSLSGSKIPLLLLLLNFLRELFHRLSKSHQQPSHLPKHSKRSRSYLLTREIWCTSFQEGIVRFWSSIWDI